MGKVERERERERNGRVLKYYIHLLRTYRISLQARGKVGGWVVGVGEEYIISIIVTI